MLIGRVSVYESAFIKPQNFAIPFHNRRYMTFHRPYPWLSRPVDRLLGVLSNTFDDLRCQSHIIILRAMQSISVIAKTNHEIGFNFWYHRGTYTFLSPSRGSRGQSRRCLTSNSSHHDPGWPADHHISS